MNPQILNSLLGKSNKIDPLVLNRLLGNLNKVESDTSSDQNSALNFFPKNMEKLDTSFDMDWSTKYCTEKNPCYKCCIHISESEISDSIKTETQETLLSDTFTIEVQETLLSDTFTIETLPNNINDEDFFKEFR
jgi:hypothetical protein